MAKFGPKLRCRYPFGFAVLEDVDPEQLCARMRGEPDDAQTYHLPLHLSNTVFVEWATSDRIQYRLQLRRHNAVVDEHVGWSGEDLWLPVPDDPHLETVAALIRESDRHLCAVLHIITPFSFTRVPISHMVSLPAADPTVLLLRLQEITAAPVIALPRDTPGAFRRHFGIELEVSTSPCDPERTGYFSKLEEFRALIDQLSVANAQSGASQKLDDVLQRCRRWECDIDVQVESLPTTVADRIAQCWDDRARRECVRHFCATAHSNEFKSPPPPYALAIPMPSGDADYAMEITCVMEIIRFMGAATPTVTATGHAAAALHVHVNVLHGTKGERELLSAEEIASVWVAWVRFDSVTRQLARPHMWRDRSSAPLYVSGPEWWWREIAWRQGDDFQSGGSSAYDVPTFFAHLYTIWQKFQGAFPSTASQKDAADTSSSNTEFAGTSKNVEFADWDATSNNPTFSDWENDDAVASHFAAHLFADKIEYPRPERSRYVNSGLLAEMFDDSILRRTLSRNCSLNLVSLARHGTVEIRRMHSTLDPTLVTYWAAFCVSFVEVFRSQSLSGLDRFMSAPSVEEGLRAFQVDQERATVAELCSIMKNHGFGETTYMIEYLLSQSV